MIFLTVNTLNNRSFVTNIVLFLMVAQKIIIHFFWITFHNNLLVVGKLLVVKESLHLVLT